MMVAEQVLSSHWTSRYCQVIWDRACMEQTTKLSLKTITEKLCLGLCWLIPEGQFVTPCCSR